MSLRALFYAYVIGGITFIPLVIVGIIFYTVYTSVPIADNHSVESKKVEAEDSPDQKPADVDNSGRVPVETYDAPRTRKGWLIVRHTYEEPPNDTGYVNIVRSFLDTRTKDPKRLRPRDMWYVVLKGTVLYLYEDEQMTECEAIELSGYDLIIYPEGLLDGELFARRNAICLKPKNAPSVAKEPKPEKENLDVKPEQGALNSKRKEKEKEKSLDTEKKKGASQDESTAWYMFVRSNTEMEDWYLALIHASDYPYQTPTLEPLQPVFEPVDMDYLVVTLDEQPDVIPMRWFNALIGRIFFSYYRTHTLEAFIIGRLMKKLSKVKRPAFLSNIVVTEVSVGNKAPTFSKPMLKELTKEGDASLEVHARYKGEVRITVEATATINLSTRLKTYTVKLVLAAILREIEGNMLIKVKRPPSNRIWYAFTQMPRIVLDVEPVVSDRQITWGMILGTIESRLKEIIQESVVLPNMDDIAFFESSPYQRRGGIWADASRKEKKAASETKFQTPLQGDEGETPALPSDSFQNNTTIPPQDQAEVYPSNQQSPALSNNSDVQTIPFAGEMETSSSSQTVRRRSRLSYTEKARAADRLPDSGEDQTVDEDRASIQTSDTSASAVSSRNKNEKIMDDSEQDGEDGAHAQPSLGLRRSLSRRSLNNDHGIAHSIDSTKGAAVECSMAVPRRRVSDATSTSTSSSPPGTNSFLSTLRSKDKQAIKDSAKEAMRKLGVNWGLRKEWTMVSSNKETTLEDPQVAKEDPSSIVRVSYADVRAAVAERKERGRASTSTTDGTGTRISISSDAVDAGRSDKNEDPVATLTSSVDTSGSAQKRSPSGSSNVAELDDLTTAARQHNPILIQPQGKTMTIPGIHASHRGEVMSLGYVAPSTTQTDNKNKNSPAINSFYRRLMKSPTIPDQEVPAEQKLEDVDTNEEAAPPALGPPIQPRLAPPPLPPRSLSPTTTGSQTSAPASDSSKATTLPNSNQLHETLESSKPLPSEGDKQEDISLSDARSNDFPPIKASLTFTPRSPPPLPPRRTQTST